MRKFWLVVTITKEIKPSKCFYRKTTVKGQRVSKTIITTLVYLEEQAGVTEDAAIHILEQKVRDFNPDMGNFTITVRCEPATQTDLTEWLEMTREPLVSEPDDSESEADEF